MKVLYAIQGTGNGHLSRARDIVPILKELVDLDLLISGTQSQVNFPWKFDYQYRGFSFHYNHKGGISYRRSARTTFTNRLIREMRNLSIEKYDLLINDFEPVSAWASRFKKIPSIALGHQAAFTSASVPRPGKKERFGEWVLRHYAPTDQAIGFHFKRYDTNIHTPVIRQEIRELQTSDQGYYTVYLPAISDKRLLKTLHQIPQADWQVFSKHTQYSFRERNVWIHPVDNKHFIHSLAHASGILTGGGFESPAEALFLGKKLFAIPIKGQYEQQCNAAALARLGVPIAPDLSALSIDRIKFWVEEDEAIQVDYPDETRSILEYLFSLHNTRRNVLSPLTA
ncbi:MAG: glycosyltransferase family protein [Bacteroidota bacterium]